MAAFAKSWRWACSTCTPPARLRCAFHRRPLRLSTHRARERCQTGQVSAAHPRPAISDAVKGSETLRGEPLPA
jgi:hypothetical protein